MTKAKEELMQGDLVTAAGTKAKPAGGSVPVYLPRIEIVYDSMDRKQPYKVTFFNCTTRSVFQKMLMFTFRKALFIFRKTLIMEGE